MPWDLLCAQCQFFGSMRNDIGFEYYVLFRALLIKGGR
ncbi:hypothetical protein EPAKOI_001036 [Cupriavidus sp. H18C2]